MKKSLFFVCFALFIFIRIHAETSRTAEEIQEKRRQLAIDRQTMNKALEVIDIRKDKINKLRAKGLITEKEASSQIDLLREEKQRVIRDMREFLAETKTWLNETEDIKTDTKANYRKVLKANQKLERAQLDRNIHQRNTLRGTLDREKDLPKRFRNKKYIANLEQRLDVLDKDIMLSRKEIKGIEELLDSVEDLDILIQKRALRKKLDALDVMKVLKRLK